MDKTRQDHRDRWTAWIPNWAGLGCCGLEKPEILETDAHAVHPTYAVDIINTASTVYRTSTELTDATAQVYEDPEEAREVRVTEMQQRGDDRSPSIYIFQFSSTPLI